MFLNKSIRYMRCDTDEILMHTPPFSLRNPIDVKCGISKKIGNCSSRVA